MHRTFVKRLLLLWVQLTQCDILYPLIYYVYDSLVQPHFKRPFPSFLVPLFQRESKCKTILMKMNSICMKMKLHAELICI